MVRITIFFLLIALVIFLIRSYFLSTSDKRKEEASDFMELVQDPNCKIYLPRSEAFEYTISGVTHCFCSENCAKEFQNKTTDF